MSSIVLPCGKDRRKIATTVKFLVNMNALPAEYMNQLHPSQISRYKNHFNPKSYVGNELMNVSNKVLDICRNVNEHAFDRNVVSGFIRLTSTIRKSFSQAKHFHKTLLQNKDQIVETVQRIQHSLSIEKCAKIIGIGTSTLRGWISSVRVRCSGSVINLCRKVHSCQLTTDETNSMKKLLENKSMLHWTLVSVYYHALHCLLATLFIGKQMECAMHK